MKFNNNLIGKFFNHLVEIMKNTYITYLLAFFVSIFVYAFFCLQFSLLPFLILIYLLGNFRLLSLLLSRFAFCCIYLFSTFIFFLLCANFLTCNFHFLHLESIEHLSVLVEALKQNALFNDNYTPSDFPTTSKEVAFDDFVYTVKICDQKTTKIHTNEKVEIELLFSEQNSTVLAKNVCKYLNPSQLNNQLIVVPELMSTHYLNLIKIDGYAIEESQKDLILFNAYSHAKKYNNIHLASEDLQGRAYSQYSTPLYDFDLRCKQFF